MIRYLVQYYTIKLFQHLRARGIRSTVYSNYAKIVNKLFALLLRLPSVAKKVNSQLDEATLGLQKKLAPSYADLPPKIALPSTGLSGLEVAQAMEQYANLPSTNWQAGKVSGAVYHGGEEMSKIWTDAFSKFSVSNPLHADIFPGIRKMDAEIVAFTLSIFNSPLPTSIVSFKLLTRRCEADAFLISSLIKKVELVLRPQVEPSQF